MEEHRVIGAVVCSLVALLGVLAVISAAANRDSHTENSTPPESAQNPEPASGDSTIIWPANHNNSILFGD